MPAECDGDDVLHSVLNVPRILAQVKQRRGSDIDLAGPAAPRPMQTGGASCTEDASARGSSYRACGLVLTCGVSPPWHGQATSVCGTHHFPATPATYFAYAVLLLLALLAAAGTYTDVVGGSAGAVEYTDSLVIAGVHMLPLLVLFAVVGSDIDVGGGTRTATRLVDMGVQRDSA